MTDFDGFRLERGDDGVATITLDVPGKFNRVSMAARDQLSQLFAELDRDEGVRFVVLTGAGGQFTAGGDIAGFLTKSPWVVSQLAKNVAAPERCSKPVIAKLQGYVFGVGLELALACDFRIAADDVQLALPEATIGMIPGSGGTQRLARLVGLGRAKDIVMRGRRVPADEALAIGLLTEVVPVDELDAAVGALVDRDRPPFAARARHGEARAQHRVRRPAPPRARARRVSPTACCSRPTTSVRACRRSSRSGRRSSPASRAHDSGRTVHPVAPSCSAADSAAGEALLGGRLDRLERAALVVLKRLVGEPERPVVVAQAEDERARLRGLLGRRLERLEVVDELLADLDALEQSPEPALLRVVEPLDLLPRVVTQRARRARIVAAPRATADDDDHDDRDNGDNGENRQGDDEWLPHGRSLAGLRAGYRRSHARPAASTVSSRGATNCMFPIARPAQPIRFTQRRKDESGIRRSSSSASSSGSSIAKHGLT